MAGIRDIDAGNTFLADFLERFNQRFAIPSANPADLHRPLNIAASRLSDILCHREQRYVGAQLTFDYDRKQIILERSEISENLGASMSNSTTLRTGHWRSNGKDFCFPTVSSARISVSATRPSLRTNGSATP